MIYTITFNPSLDYIMRVENFLEGETNRSYQEEMYPGGKGFNVSTVLQRLGFENTALGFVAGFTGDEIEKQLKLRGIQLDLIHLKSGLSRINVKLKSQKETEINGCGPMISKDELDALFCKVDQMKDEDILVLAGSIPSSLPNDIYQQILHRKHIRTIVDATGELLLKVLPYHPFLVKPNYRELEEIFHTEIQNQDELIMYAKKLQKLGALNVLVSLGKDGAILISEDQHVYYCEAAKGKLVNSVGSGDSMVAGFIAGYLKNKDYKEALKLGNACGGATAFSADLATINTIKDIYQQIEVQQII